MKPIACLAAILAAVAGAANAATAERPRLIVAISVDQFSAGLFDQYRSRFRHGLKRLADEGVLFPSGYQSHAITETCPGHSTLLTGRHPSGTGIVANNWLDRATGRPVYCVEDASVSVPGRPARPRGPAQLRVSTLGEWLRAADPQSRTVAVGGKDRAAITMAGHDPAAVFWWDGDLGFNSYVKPGESAEATLAPVAGFNAALWKGWSRATPQWKVSDRRCLSLQGPGSYGGVTTDHRLPPMPEREAGKPLSADARFDGWLRASPLFDAVTLDLAGRLADRFALGKRGSTDLLAIALSATDYIGHRFGNQGPEMCDQMAWLDRSLGDFLARLDRLRIPYAVVLSADHGATDAAERNAMRAIPARRIAIDLPAAMNAWLRANAHIGYDAFLGDSESLLFDPAAPTADRERIVAIARAALASRDPGLPWAGMVADAFTRAEIAATPIPTDVPPDELSLPQRYAESFDAERSPDIFVALIPFASLGAVKPGGGIAGHGSPWNADRRVPILFWRSGGKAFEQYLPIDTVDIAPTLAALAGIAAPATDGRCRDLDPGPASTCPSP